MRDGVYYGLGNGSGNGYTRKAGNNELPRIGSNGAGRVQCPATFTLLYFLSKLFFWLIQQQKMAIFCL